MGDYQHTKTDYYLIRRSGVLGFESMPADGSSKLGNDLMDSIEPFDYSQAVPFNAAYLSGFLADKYDEDANAVHPRIQERVRNSTRDVFQGTVAGYSHFRLADQRMQVKNKDTRYLLLPVWLLNTKYQGQDYVFAMNGQSGRFVGNLPISKKRVAAWFLGLTAGISVLMFLISLFLV